MNSTQYVLALSVLLILPASIIASPATAVEDYVEGPDGRLVWAEVVIWYNCYYPPVSEPAKCYAHGAHASDAFIYGELDGNEVYGVNRWCETPNLNGGDLFTCETWSSRAETVCASAWGWTTVKGGGEVYHPPIQNELC